VIWSDQCELIGESTAIGLRKHADCLITYTVDDPFGQRDKRRFSLYRKSLKHYDLTVVVRQPNVVEAYAQGAAKVLRVYRSADEVAHRSLVLIPEEKKHWDSEVVFIGTWMPERGPFLKNLLERRVPLTLYGDRWQKAKEWSALKKAWRGPSLVGDGYVKAIQAAKVCLGLLSEGNRDLHTQRSAEIPCIGSILCAQRTEEHVAMYREDKEAVFWSTPEECTEKCFALLADEHKRKTIARAGRERCLQSGYLNEPIMETILKTSIERKPLNTLCR
jgi:spore maturation protein CgeB